MNQLRIMPHSIEAEQAVVGGIMLDNNAYHQISDLLAAEDFYAEHHQMIYRCIIEMINDRMPVDIVTVSDWMKGRRRQNGESFHDFIGGLAYLADLAKDTPSAARIASYAHIVSNHALRREYIQLGMAITEQAFDNDSGDASLDRLKEFAAQGLFSLEQKKEAANKGFTSMKSALKKELSKIELMREEKISLLGAASHLDELDKKLSGFEKGKVYVVAGRPSMGKTTLGLNIAEGIATNTDDPFAVFSIEMPTGDVVQKMMAASGSVNYSNIRNPWQLCDVDWAGIATGVKKLSGLGIYFDDSSRQTPADIRARCRRLVQDTGKPLSGILIDYVQLMGGAANKDYFNKEAEINYISGEIRAMAKDFECPIILISQLNRSVESRPNKRPVMSDLRDSGALEQDASAIIFVYRDEVYDPINSPDKGVAELIVAKHRGGQTGTVRCRWLGKNQRFDDFTDNVGDYQPMTNSGREAF